MQRHLLHSITCAKAQQRQHQADTQIIVGTERRTLAVPQGDPLAGLLVIAGRGHHRNAGRGEADRHAPPRKIGPQCRVESVRQAQAAYQQRHGLPIHPFGIGRFTRLLRSFASRIEQDLHGTVPRFRRMVDAQCQQGRVLQQVHVDGRRLLARHGLLRGFQSKTRVMFKPRADHGESVEVAFDGERRSAGASASEESQLKKYAPE